MKRALGPLLLVALLGCTSSTENGVIERVPQFSQITKEISPFLIEFGTNQVAKEASMQLQNTNALRGEVMWIDRLQGLYVVQTSESKYWTTVRQRVFLCDSKGTRIEELDLHRLGGLAVKDPKLVLKGPKPVILLTCWNTNNWTEMYIFAYDIGSKEFEKVCPGWGLEVSPDRKKIAFVRTDDDGFHSIHILNVDSFHIDTIMSLWEDDPGSGISFRYRWSPDSNALLIEGRHGGFTRKNQGPVEESKILYVLDTRRVFDVTHEIGPKVDPK